MRTLQNVLVAKKISIVTYTYDTETGQQWHSISTVFSIMPLLFWLSVLWAVCWGVWAGIVPVLWQVEILFVAFFWGLYPYTPDVGGSGLVAVGA